MTNHHWVLMNYLMLRGMMNAMVVKPPWLLGIDGVKHTDVFIHFFHVRRSVG
jgi:hypothetical protein